MTTIKICGLSEEATLRAAIDAGADMVGFVHFAKSPRHVEVEKISSLIAVNLPAQVDAVVVTVNPTDELITQIDALAVPRYLQLHGNESPERVKSIRENFPRLKLIKAIPVASGDDIAKAHAYAAHVDMLMFDAKPPANGLPGGNGLSFDWALMKNREFAKPWLLSGGLNAENVKDAIRQSGAVGVDVSSGVESAPGKKDASLIAAFIAAVS